MRMLSLLILPKVWPLFLALVLVSISTGECGTDNSPLASANEKESSAPLTIVTAGPKEKEWKRPAQDERKKGEEAAAALGLRWEYDEYPEKMGRGLVQEAVVRSCNEVEFDNLAYRYPQRATLRLRIHPSYGKGVVLAVVAGQFLCSSQKCQVEVRFDDGPAENFTAVAPPDTPPAPITTELFLRDYDRFLAAAHKSRKVSIEAQFYQQGSRVFAFDISGLMW